MVACQHRLLCALRKGAIGAIAALFGLSVLGLIAVNLATERQEAEIEKEQTEFLKKHPSEFSKKYSYTPSDTSAIRLEQLAAQFGIKIEMPNSIAVPIAKTNQQAFEVILPQLNAYLDTQFQQTRDRFDPPPPELLRYVQSYAGRLARLRNHLRSNQVPNWEKNLGWLEQGKVKGQMPSFSGLVQLQKVLLLDAIAQSNRGNSSQVLENLEASWRLSESLQTRPELTGQLAHIILMRNQLSAMRYFDNLPPQWQQRLAERAYFQSMLTAVESEAFLNYNFLQNPKGARFEKIDNKLGTQYTQAFAGWKWSGIPGSLYLRHSAVANYQAVKTARDRLQKDSICQVKQSDLPEKQLFFTAGLTPQLALSYLQKAVQLELETELTQKVLQAKAMDREEGKLPRSLPNLESSVCPALKWEYQLVSDKEALLSLNFDVNLDEEGAPLKYSIALDE